jgi:hypothetical protein
MTSRAPITRAEQARMLTSFSSAFRWEAQRRYAISYEADDLAWWAADGSAPRGAWWPEWLQQITRLTRAGSTIARVRVLDEPPTTYQRWELFLTPQNIAAGEDIRLLARATARDLGLPEYDWWLLDGGRLIIIAYNDAGEVATRTLVTDPGEIDRHSAWRDLAVSHAHPAERYAAA